MICRLLEIIDLLDEVQHWIDTWTKYHEGGRSGSLTRISAILEQLGDYESARVVDRLLAKCFFLPFKGRESVGPTWIAKLKVTP